MPEIEEKIHPDSPATSRSLPQSRSLLQLVPRFRPDIDGLGDFSLYLGDALWKHSGLSSSYVVWRQPRVALEPAPFSSINLPHSIIRLPKTSPRALRAALNTATEQGAMPVLLLHYTSYAFSKEGVAWWLPGVLRAFVARGGRVVSFFHELYATGRFPRKIWLTSGLQKRIFREILALSTAGITSSEDYLERMRAENSTGRPLILAGIGSNVGELDSPPPLAARARRLAIFGVYTSRQTLYEQHMPLLRRLVDHLGVTEVADIGTAGEDRQLLNWVKDQFGSKFHVYGALPATEVSRLLADSSVGVVNYDYHLRSKSGIVAAYQSHAVPTVIFTPIQHLRPTQFADDALTAEELMGLGGEAPPGAQGQSAVLNSAALLNAAGPAGFAYYQRNRSYASILRQILPWIQP